MLEGRELVTFKGLCRNGVVKEIAVLYQEEADQVLLAGKRLSQGGHGSVQFCYGLCMERFKRVQSSVPTVPLRKGFLGTSVEF